MKTLTLSFALLSAALFAIGCEQPTDSETGTDSTQTDDDGHDHGDDDHAHDEHAAPHGGDLIDLGRDHAYHAELVDNHETKTLIVYIMDKDLKPLSIDAATINLTLIAGDKTDSFDLTATSDGGSSEFSSGDEKMMALIDAKGVTGKIRANIEGKPFTGSFTHNHDGHDHDDHDGHDHGDHDDHDHDDHK